MPKLEVALPADDLLRRGRRAGAESATTPPPGSPRRRICRPPPTRRLSPEKSTQADLEVLSTEQRLARAASIGTEPICVLGRLPRRCSVRSSS